MRESAAATIEATPPPAPARLRLVSVDIAAAWPHLAEALERVRAKGALWPLSWAKDRLDTGNACAFRFIRDGVHVAYLVVERIKSFDVCLQVWVLSAPLHALVLADRDEVIALIDQLARDVGANRWRCEGRDGWAWVLKDRSSRTATVYERDIA